ncbi:MAG: BspA family leucine-rich repeat surface protein [Clostridia bacterium]|nr:BspA family leucine-rich repeat surface protein [Clostridia bacterium]
MKKVKTTIYVVLYSFLVCIAMSMGVFAVSMPQIETYTNIFYHTKTPMIGKTNFQNAYLEFNEEASSIGNPVITEIYFDSYTDADRATYAFARGGGSLVSTNVLSTIDVSLAQDESIFAHYYTYYNRETSSHIGAMFVLSTETITMPADASDFFRETKLYDYDATGAPISVLTKIEFNNIDTSLVTTINNMFNYCRSLTSLDLSMFDTPKLTSCYMAFFGCNHLTSLNVSGLKTSLVTDFGYMFTHCSRLPQLNVSNFNTSSATNMGYMFHNCTSLTSLDLTNFTTNNVTNFRNMFYNCGKLEMLDLASFNTSSAQNMTQMFYVARKVTNIYVGTGWNTDNVVESTDMFSSCISLPNYDPNCVDKTYAYAGIDESTGLYGYLTFKE